MPSFPPVVLRAWDQAEQLAGGGRRDAAAAECAVHKHLRAVRARLYRLMDGFRLVMRWPMSWPKCWPSWSTSAGSVTSSEWRTREPAGMPSISPFVVSPPTASNAIVAPSSA